MWVRNARRCSPLSHTAERYDVDANNSSSFFCLSRSLSIKCGLPFAFSISPERSILAVSQPAQTVREIRTPFVMINPSGDEFGEDIPLSASADVGEEKLREGSARVSEMAGGAWEQAREKTGTARARTEIFLRENPIPTLLGAFGTGIAIGLAIRVASTHDTKEEVK